MPSVEICQQCGKVGFGLGYGCEFWEAMTTLLNNYYNDASLDPAEAERKRQEILKEAIAVGCLGRTIVENTIIHPNRTIRGSAVKKS